MNGILVVDKPQGFTSFDVVAKMRGICRTKKIGHGGTLDPMATGVLPVFVGPAVKAVDLQPQQDKEYEAEVLFGVATDTGDLTGEVVQTSVFEIERVALEKAAESFLGTRQQLPPMYSAVKVRGKPLYRYAREGEKVERKPRTVTFHQIEILGEAGAGRWRLRVRCSKGAYIRVLAEELGQALGGCATLAALRRTAAGVFTLGDAYRLEQVQKAKDEDSLQRLFVPTERVFESLPSLSVTEEEKKRLLHGAAVHGRRDRAGRYRVKQQEEFLGLGIVDEEGSLQVEKLFVERDGS
ncbi:tRNA pseudouridine(55) synthase TruB [Ruminococcaceae bacterium OttesenSCG-928-I18]|nr:tRNA pseudouridine(55) synthase TruB [Ruminococcaceae bacterium OttesenSCG-928-I18]